MLTKGFASELRAGSNLSFTLLARDSFNNSLTLGGDSVRVATSSSKMLADVRDGGNGHYHVRARTTVVGSYWLSLAVGSAPQANLSVSVAPAKPYAPNCVLRGAGLGDGQVGVRQDFTLVANDAFGNGVKTGGMLVRTSCIGQVTKRFLGLRGTDHSNGTYSFSYTGKELDNYTLAINVGKLQLTFPITLGPGPLHTRRTASTVSGGLVAHSLPSGLVTKPPTGMSVVAGAQSNVTLIPKDTFFNNVSSVPKVFTYNVAYGAGAASSGVVAANVIAQDANPLSATYKEWIAHVTLTQAGVYDLSVKYGAANLLGAPFSLTITHGAISARSKLVVNKDFIVLAGVLDSVSLEAYDAYGNRVHSSGE